MIKSEAGFLFGSFQSAKTLVYEIGTVFRHKRDIASFSTWHLCHVVPYEEHGVDTKSDMKRLCTRTEGSYRIAWIGKTGTTRFSVSNDVGYR
jgi:hypothetical protein